MKKYLSIAATVVAALVLGLVGSAPANAATTYTVSVTVTNTSGTRLQYASVDLTASGQTYSSYWGQTDASGVAKITDVAPGTYQADVAAYDNAGTKHSAAATLVVTTANVATTVKVGGITFLAGTVKVGSSAVKSASVSFSGVGSSSKLYAYATTDSAGRYSTQYVTPGTYTAAVYAYNSGYLTTYSGNTVRGPDAKTVTVKSGLTTTTNISLVRSATVTGKVVDSKGHALKGISVYASNTNRAGYAYATTDAKGAYVLKGLATGPVQVGASRTKSGVTVSGAVKVSAKQGATKRAATIKLKAAGSAKVTGKITTSGSKVVTQGVTLLSSKKAYVATATPSKSGKVTFAGLKAGTYTVVVDGTNITKKVTVKSGKTKSFGTIKRGKLTTIKGVVKTSGKKAAAGAYVYLVDSYGTTAGSAQVNSKGRYTIKGLISGKYTVWASPNGTKDYAVSAKITVKRGKNVAKNLNLAKGSTVTGYVKHGSRGVEGVAVYVGGGYAVTDSRGKYTVIGVAPGKNVVSVSDPYVGGYHNAGKKVTVKKGKTLSVSTIKVS